MPLYLYQPQGKLFEDEQEDHRRLYIVGRVGFHAEPKHFDIEDSN